MYLHGVDFQVTDGPGGPDHVVPRLVREAEYYMRRDGDAESFRERERCEKIAESVAAPYYFQRLIVDRLQAELEPYLAVLHIAGEQTRILRVHRVGAGADR